MVHLCFIGKYNFVVEYKQEDSFVTADVFKIGSNEELDLDYLAAENDDDILN